MSVTEIKDRCPTCLGPVVRDKFDVNFETPDGERLFFGLPAAYCSECKNVFLDPDVEILFGFNGERRIFAIKAFTKHDLPNNFPGSASQGAAR